MNFLRLPKLVSPSSWLSLMCRIVWFLCLFLHQMAIARHKRKVKLMVTPSAIASFLDLCFPGDDSRKEEGGTRVTDPKQPSLELVPQINGFPTMLDEIRQK